MKKKKTKRKNSRKRGIEKVKCSEENLGKK